MREDVTKKIAYLNSALFESLSSDPSDDEPIDFEAINKRCRDKDAKIKTHAEDPKETPQHTICMQHFNVYIYAGKEDVWAYVYIEPLVGDIVKCVPPRSVVYVWLSQGQVEKLVEVLSVYKGDNYLAEGTGRMDEWFANVLAEYSTQPIEDIPKFQETLP